MISLQLIEKADIDEMLSTLPWGYRIKMKHAILKLKVHHRLIAYISFQPVPLALGFDSFLDVHMPPFYQ